MAFFGGGGPQAGGFSQNMGGANMRTRGADSWDEDYLGSVYDAEVVRRLIPYMSEWKFHAFASLFLMVVTAVSQFIQPMLIGLITSAAIRGDTHAVTIYAGLMIGFAISQAASQMTQQLLTT